MVDHLTDFQTDQLMDWPTDRFSDRWLLAETHSSVWCNALLIISTGGYHGNSPAQSPLPVLPAVSHTVFVCTCKRVGVCRCFNLTCSVCSHLNSQAFIFLQVPFSKRSALQRRIPSHHDSRRFSFFSSIRESPQYVINRTCNAWRRPTLKCTLNVTDIKTTHLCKLAVFIWLMKWTLVRRRPLLYQFVMELMFYFFFSFTKPSCTRMCTCVCVCYCLKWTRGCVYRCIS